MKKLILLFLFGRCAFAQTNLSFTSLDGVRYANVTVAAVRDDSLIVLWDGGGGSLPFTNLPEAIRERFHYVPPPPQSTHAAHHARSRETRTADELDVFLANHTNSSLSEITNAIVHPETNIQHGPNDTYIFSYEVYLWVSPEGFELESKTTWDTPLGFEDKNNGAMRFEYGQESMVSNVIDKFFEWSSAAAADHSENFKKQIGKYRDETMPLFRTFDFEWDFEPELWVNGEVDWTQCSLSADDERISIISSRAMTYAPAIYGRFNSCHLKMCQELMPSIPQMKASLASRIRHQDAQMTLFH